MYWSTYWTRSIAFLAALVGTDAVQGADLFVLSTSPGRLSAEYGWSLARRTGADGRDVALRRLEDGTIRRIDLGTGHADYVLATIPGVTPSVSQSLDGSIAGWSAENRAGVFDAVSGVERWRFEGGSTVLVTVSPAADRVLLDEAGVGVTLLDLDGQRIRSIASAGHDHAVVGWSSDGARLAVSWIGEIRCMDARTGQDLGDPIVVVRDVDGAPRPSVVFDLDWHPEHPWIAAGLPGTELRVLDVLRGEERWRTAHDFEDFLGDSGYDDVRDVEFSPDGVLLVSGVTPIGGTHAFRAQSGERVWSVAAMGWSRSPLRVEFAASGATLRVGGPVNVAPQVIVAQSGETLASFPKEWASGMMLSPSGDRVMLADDVLDAKTLALRYRRHEFRDGGYVLIAPSGHYDGTPDAIRNAWVSRQSERWPLDCFDAILHDPSAVRRAAAGEGTVATPSLPRPPDIEVLFPIARSAIMDPQGRVATNGGPSAPIRMAARSQGGVAWFEVERVGEAGTRPEVLRIGSDADASPDRVLEWTIPEAWRGAEVALRIRARAADGTRSKPVLLTLAPEEG